MPTYSTAEPIPYDERGDYPGRDWPWWKDAARVATMGAYHPGDRDISRENDKVLEANTKLKIEQGKAAAEIDQMSKTMRELGASEETIQTMAREMFKESETMAKAAANKKNMALDAGRGEKAGDLGRAETDKGIAEAEAGKGEGELRGRFAKARLGTKAPEVTAKTEENKALLDMRLNDRATTQAIRDDEAAALQRSAEQDLGLPVETARTVAELQKLAAEQKLNAARQSGRLSTIESGAFTDDERRRMMRNRALNEGSVNLGAGSIRRDNLGNEFRNDVIYTMQPKKFGEFDPNQVVEQMPVRGQLAPIQAPSMTLGPSTASPAPVSPAPGGAPFTMTPAEFEAQKNARKYAPRTGQ